MADIHPVVLLKAGRIRPVSSRRATKGSAKLPFSLPGKDKSIGLMRHKDGSVSRVLKLRGLNLLDILSSKGGPLLWARIKKLLRDNRVDLQFVFSNWAAPASQGLESVHGPSAKESLYLDWFHSYQSKWLDHIRDLQFVSQVEHYIVVTSKGAGPSTGKGKGSKLADDACIVRLDRMVKQFRQELDQMDLPQELLSRRELRHLLYRQVNPFSFGFNSPSPPEILNTSSMPEFEVRETARSSSLQIGETWFSSGCLSELPEATSLGWLTKVLEQDFPFTLSVQVSGMDQGIIKKSLIQKQAKANNNLVQAVIDSVLTGEDSAVELGVYVTTWADTKNISLEQLNIIREAMTSTGASMSSCVGRQLAAWKSCLASGFDHLNSRFAVTSTIAADSWTLVHDTISDGAGILLGTGSSWKQIMLFDPFQASRKNSLLVLNARGTRASWTVPLLTFRYVIPYTVVMLGAGYCYSFMEKCLGSELSSSFGPGKDEDASDFVINPCQLDFVGQSPDQTKVKFLVDLIEKVVSAATLEEAALSYSVLEVSIIKAYGRAGKENRFPILSELLYYLPPRRGQLVREKLLSYLNSKRGKFLNGQTNFSLSSSFNLVETSFLAGAQEKYILEIVMLEYMLRLSRLQQSKSDSAKIVFVIPEIDSLISGEIGRDLLYSALNVNRRDDVAWLLGVARADLVFQRIDFEELASIVGSILVPEFESRKSSNLSALIKLTDSQIQFLQKPSKKSRDQRAILKLDGRASALRIFPSPMEYSVISDEEAFVVDRIEKLARVKENNPRLSKTDVCRQTIYYQGLALGSC